MGRGKGNYPASVTEPAGLFRRVQSGGHIKNVGIINPNIRTTDSSYSGGLAGTLRDGGRVDTSNVAGVRIVTTVTNANAGWLVGNNLGGAITTNYAAGPVTGYTHAGNYYGGLVGWVALRQITNTPASITLSYCDSGISPQTGSNCIGDTGSNPGVVQATAYTTQELQAPTEYADSICAGWNLDLSLSPDGANDNPWHFARGRLLPPPMAPNPRHNRLPVPRRLPRSVAAAGNALQPGASDHPEIYENPRHEMTATCDVQYNADGAPESSTITFNLGNYRGQVILHLAQWNGQYFTGHESLDIPMPTFERDGQTATVRVTTNPAQTRFLLDSISPTTNLVLDYADCHTERRYRGAGDASIRGNPGGNRRNVNPSGAKGIQNDRYEMTASRAVQHNADGEPESSQITFNLGNYQATVILSVSLWNGEYYASLEGHNLTEPTLERASQTATVLVTTNPAETRFLLDGTPNGLHTNLLLGYADCHTASE